MIKKIECNRLGYDIKFKNEKKLVVSGFYDKNDYVRGGGFDLYEIDIFDNFITPLLESYKKYGLKNKAEYVSEYFEKMNIPSIGINGFFDIYGNNLLYIWEGNLELKEIKKKSTDTIRAESHFYKKPNGDILSIFYKNKKYKETWSNRKKYSKIVDLIYHKRHVVIFFVNHSENKFIVCVYNLSSNKAINEAEFPIGYDHIDEFIGSSFDKSECILYVLFKTKNGKFLKKYLLR